MNLHINLRILTKLKYKHRVSRAEIEECFRNRTKGSLEDTREEHQTDPPTRWFIAETCKGRLLKVVFIAKLDTDEVKTVYEPNANEVKIYEKYAQNI